VAFEDSKKLRRPDNPHALKLTNGQKVLPIARDQIVSGSVNCTLKYPVVGMIVGDNGQ